MVATPTPRPVNPLTMQTPDPDNPDTIVQALKDIHDWANVPDRTFGIAAKKPTSGSYPGVKYFATDTLIEYLWTGTAWVVNAQYFKSGLAASRPASGDFVGQKWYSTDSGIETEWSGSVWRGIRTVKFAVTASAVTTSAGTESGAFATLAVANQECAGTLRLMGDFYLSLSVIGDQFEVHGKVGGSTFTSARIAGYSNNLTIIGDTPMSNGSGVTITTTMVRVAGTGTCSSFADAFLDVMYLMFIPS